MKAAMTAALSALGCFAVMATPASAAIVCNDDGDCWHVKDRYEYRPEFKVHVYPDTWAWGKHEHTKYRWREHDGRGYWRGGAWVGF